jgi:non-ribosomal peptide synthetase component F
MLAVLRLGAAFVPLDPGYGPAQLADIVSDSGPSCLIADPELAARFGADRWPTRTIGCRELAATPGDAAAEIATGPDDPAYIMYTSGSTGRPKGVVVPHRAILRLVLGADFVELGPAQTFLQLAPLAFDASTLEIWGSLLTGGRLVIVPEAHPTLDDVGRVIAASGVTALWLTAGLFHLMVEQRLAALRPLRQLLAGGDVLSPSHCRTVLQAFPHIRLINGYGPTENTTFTCCHAITEADLAVGHGADRPSDQRHVRSCPRPGSASGARRRGGAARCWRRRCRPRLSEPAGAHGRAFRS